MHHLLRLTLLALLTLTPGFAQGTRDIGRVEVAVEGVTIPVRISGAPAELNTLAHLAFQSHGRYRRVTAGQAYDLKFSAAGGNQVRVEITRGSAGTPVMTQVVPGTTLRHALLRAADLAVEQTNGLGLRGFFTARLAFVGEATGRKEVYISDLFLGEAKRITSDSAPVLTPRWSPDGTRLLYTSYFKSGFPDIFQHDLTTYQRTTFVSYRGTNSGARFSPSGRQVAMVLTGEGTPEIYVSDAQGRNVSRKTRSDAVKASPCWSPDGSQIVFTMEPGPQLYLIGAGGGQPRRLATPGFTYAAEPDWSTVNPNRIACTLRVGRQYQIGVYDLSRGRAEVVSKASFDGIEPSWLGDGRHLVYTARNRTTSVLCILDTETGRSTPISPASFGAAMSGSAWIR